MLLEKEEDAIFIVCATWITNSCTCFFNFYQSLTVFHRLPCCKYWHISFLWFFLLILMYILITVYCYIIQYHIHDSVYYLHILVHLYFGCIAHYPLSLSSKSVLPSLFSYPLMDVRDHMLHVCPIDCCVYHTVEGMQFHPLLNTSQK